MKVLLLILGILSTSNAYSGFVSGTPTQVMKSDYGVHLVYVNFQEPIEKGNCDSGNGVVILDSNESSEAALPMALAAYASKKKFQCYVGGECSRITGALTTFPVCIEYPSITD
ncbi:MAG: hypothetical protein MK185_15770 [Saccharospirillaceae bacterium]|nr:hypothetical protein [Saccharospirillaceae bacterium]